MKQINTKDGALFEPIFSKYTVVWLQKLTPLHTSLLTNLLDRLNALPRVLSQGRFGELVVAQNIGIRLGVDKNSNSWEFFGMSSWNSG